MGLPAGLKRPGPGIGHHPFDRGPLYLLDCHLNRHRFQLVPEQNAQAGQQQDYKYPTEESFHILMMARKSRPRQENAAQPLGESAATISTRDANYRQKYRK
jgi:hypothetical protein